MINHYIHYLKRDVKIRFPKDPQSPFFADVQNLDEGFECPRYHITRRKSGPSDRIKSGDVIWLLSCLKSPWGTLPPSLDAKFVIGDIQKLKDGRIKYIATQNSKWFPLFDASKLLESLWTIDNKGAIKRLIKDRDKPLGFYLQSIRQLNEGKQIVNWSDKISSLDYDFISYRIADGTKDAYWKAQDLVNQGKVVFWDRFSLPRRLAERRELVKSEALDQHLMESLKKAKKVWGIETPKYFVESSYAQKESTIAKQHNKYISVQLKGNTSTKKTFAKL